MIKYFKYLNGLTTEERQWLENHDPLTYAADKSAPPLRYVDDKGIYQGVVVDYINALSLELGTEIKTEPLVWSEALEKLRTGKTDICDMFKSEKRAEKYLFTDPIYNLRTVLLTRSGDQDLNELSDLEGKRLGLQQGDYAVGYVKNKLGDKGNYLFVNNLKEAIQLLLEGEVKAVIGDEPVVSHLISELEAENRVRIVNPPLYERDTRLAVPKEQKKLVSILNKGIFELQRKGILEGIQQKWFGLSASIVYANFSHKIFFTFLILSLVLITILAGFYYWNYSLQREVDKRTRELRTIFDGITSFMMVINENYEIENVNQATADYFGYDKNDFVGLNFRQFFNVIGIKNNNNFIKEALSKSKEVSREINYENKVFQMTTYPLESDQKNNKRILVVIKDITEKLITERKILQSNKMAAIGQLTAGVAHEIRNPLGLIRNYIYLLKDEVKYKSDEFNYFEKIEEAIAKISGIIDNMLNFSRLDSEGKEWFYIYEFLERIFELEKKKLKDNQIEYKIEGNRGMKVYMNKDIFEHIFLNLISNSVDAINNSQGQISVQYEQIYDDLQIRISDNGEGIKEESLDNIFNPFFTTKIPGEGTGLGLYVVYNEVQKTGGSIKVYSEYGKGTTFIMNFPVKIKG